MTRPELRGSPPDIQEKLDEAKQTQQDFWDAMSALESELGYVEMDDNRELENVTVEDLIDEYADKAEGDSDA